jgi:lipid A 3-O-deacylase
MPKLVIFLFLIFFVCVVTAQKQNLKSFKQEITVITDNDNYDFELTDRYYSNGFIIQYNRAAKPKHPATIKKLLQFEAAHKVYNPYTNRHSVQNVLLFMDRSFAGWLGVSAGVTQIKKNENILQYGVSVGILGPSARGRQIQEGWHKLIGLYKVYGWEYQVNDEWGLNFSGAYYHSLMRSKQGNNISLHAVGQATAGNTLTNAAAGLLLKTGWLNKENETGYWSGNLGDKSESFKRNEFIFFFEPVLQYQVYNATVQGGLFINDKGLYTGSIEPLVFQTKTGIMFTGNRFGLRWYYTFRTKEATAMRKGEHWGSIGATVRF